MHYCNCAIVLIYLVVVLAMIKLRLKEKNSNENVFKVPGGLIIPFIGIASITWLLTSLSKLEVISP